MTETVYRKQIRLVLIEGADAMDRIFPAADSALLAANRCSVARERRAVMGAVARWGCCTRLLYGWQS